MLMPSSPFMGMGVDVFFVVSGFVIFCSIRPNQTSGDFLARRILRIVPIYYVLTLVALTSGFEWSGRTLWNSFFFIPLWDKEDFATPVIGVGWSLCYEFYFYLLVAFFGVVTPKRRVLNLIGFLALAVLLAIAKHYTALRFLFNPLSLEFFAGILIFYQWRKGRLNSVPLGCVLVGMGIASGLLLNIPGGLSWVVEGVTGFLRTVLHAPGLKTPDVATHLNVVRVLRSGVPSALLVAGVVSLEAVIRRMPDFLSALGGASYSLYLIHIFVVYGVGKIYSHGWIGPIGGCILIFALSILLAFVSRAWLELKLSSWISDKLGHSRSRLGSVQ